VGVYELIPELWDGIFTYFWLLLLFFCWGGGTESSLPLLKQICTITGGVPSAAHITESPENQMKTHLISILYLTLFASQYPQPLNVSAEKFFCSFLSKHDRL